MSRFLEFREENDADFDAVASLHDTAFGGGMESRIVTRIRQGHRPYLSYVALSDSRVCGHALFSEVDVIGRRLLRLHWGRWPCCRRASCRV